MLTRRLHMSVLLAALVLLVPACGVVDSVSPGGPVAAIAADPPSGTVPAPVEVTFDASPSTGNITGYRWQVDGMQVGTSKVLHHTFDVAGDYEVTLVVLAGDVEATTEVTYNVRPVSGFDITLVFEEGSFTAEQRTMMQAAADRWEQMVVGDIPDNSAMPLNIRNSCLAAISQLGGPVAPALQGVDLFDDLLVYVFRYNQNSSTLAQAGPCWWGDRLPNYGFMQVNERHLSMMTTSDSLEHVVIHELGHVLGIGPLWRRTGEDLMRPGLQHCNDSSLDPGIPRTNKGARAVGEYHDLGGVGEPLVSPGCSHWDQATFGNESLVPSRVIRPEGDNLTPVSRMTLGSLHDLGYVVDYGMADAYSLPVHGARVPETGHEYLHGDPRLLTPEPLTH